MVEGGDDGGGGGGGGGEVEMVGGGGGKRIGGGGRGETQLAGWLGVCVRERERERACPCRVPLQRELGWVRRAGVCSESRLCVRK